MITVILTVVGLLICVQGVRIRLDKSKSWFLIPGIYPPKALMYVGIPLGILFLVFAFLTAIARRVTDDTWRIIFETTVYPLLAITLLLAFWRPRWIKPHWERWLEENYNHKLDGLIAAARRDPKSWEKRVATQEGLEEWAREVAGEPRRKQDLPR